MTPFRRTGKEHSRHLHWLTMLCAMLLLVSFVRAVLVLLYSGAIPFFDQWDELYYKARPWLDGTWNPGQLFLPHNEHRVAFTRLIDLGLLWANGNVFDNRVINLANALLYAGMWALLYILFTYRTTNTLQRLIFFVWTLVLGSLPFDYENLIVGFQNAFYLMEIGAIALVALAAYRKFSTGTALLLGLVSVANLFTLASGLLAAIAACAVVALRLWHERAHRARMFLAIMLMLAAAAYGFFLIPPGVPHVIYAQGLMEPLHALLVCMSWPLESADYPRLLFAMIMWLPAVIELWRIIQKRETAPDEMFAVGLCAWACLQFLAIAHARGHDMDALPSRYSEIPAIGLAANFWLSLKLAARVRMPRRWLAEGAIVTGTCLVAFVFLQRLPHYFVELKYRRQYSQIETWHVRQYFAGKQLPVLVPGTPLLPYPDLDRLRVELSDPTMRRLLPPNVFDKPDPKRHTPLSNAAEWLAGRTRAMFPVLSQELAIARFVPDQQPAAGESTNHNCSLDQINNTFAPNDESARSGDLIWLTGWAANSARIAPRSSHIVLVGSDVRYSLETMLSDPRPDIENALQSRRAFRSGFSLVASTQDVPPGTYRIVLQPSGGRDNACTATQRLMVRP